MSQNISHYTFDNVIVGLVWWPSESESEVPVCSGPVCPWHSILECWSIGLSGQWEVSWTPTGDVGGHWGSVYLAIVLPSDWQSLYYIYITVYYMLYCECSGLNFDVCVAVYVILCHVWLFGKKNIVVTWAAPGVHDCVNYRLGAPVCTSVYNILQWIVYTWSFCMAGIILHWKSVMS